MKKNSTGYLLGVDVGNTKTHALISNISGELVGFGESSCGNYEVVGVNGFKQSINHSINCAMKMSNICKEQIVSMGFGISGYDWPSEQAIMIEGIKSLNINAPYKFVNDVVLGILSGTSEGWGVAVDAGTGNNVRGRDKTGRIGRVTGNSVQFGEYGGAYEIIRLAMIAITYAWSLRGPKTKLTELFMDFAGVKSEDLLIEGLAMEKIQLEQSLVKPIFDIAVDGDQVALDIIQWSARELGLNVNAVIRQLNLQKEIFEVVLIGSIFRSGDLYIEPLGKTIREFAPNAELKLLNTIPVYGSIILAAENLGLPTKKLYHTLNTHPENVKLLSDIKQQG